MNWDVADLASLESMIWSALAKAVSDLNHPFRLATLATRSSNGAALRTVVLRTVTDHALSCYTDVRTTKVMQVAEDSGVEWLFYDAQGRVQIRAHGTAVVIQGNETARAAWMELPLSSRMLYCSYLTPGTPVATPEAAWPPFVLMRSATVEAVERSFANFAILQTQIDSVDFLQLDWRVQRRAHFAKAEQTFRGQWVSP